MKNPVEAAWAGAGRRPSGQPWHPVRGGPLRYVFGERELRPRPVRATGWPVPCSRWERQVFDVLAVLLRDHDRVVLKEELLDTVWGSRFVTESALASRVKAARRAIGDDGRRQEAIRTVHGRGYQFVGQVRTAGPQSTAARHEPIRYALSDGLNIAYQLTGRGERDIVLVAGFVSHLELDWTSRATPPSSTAWAPSAAWSASTSAAPDCRTNPSTCRTWRPGCMTCSR